MKTIIAACLLSVFAMLVPQASHADITQTLGGMQPVLDSVRNEMQPLSGKLIDVGRAIAGFGALIYIASRVWRQLAAAEPIDFYPLLRPFGLGLAIMFFPAVIDLMNGVLQPTVSATAGMVEGSNNAIEALLKQKEEAVKNSDLYNIYVGEDGNGNRSEWYKYTHPEESGKSSEGGLWEGIGNDIRFWMDKQSYNFRNSIKQWMSEVLQVIFAAASLCINTIRTFYLIVLSIIGPIVLGLSVIDGFQQSLIQWMARYINVFLWLPVSNIFGSILGKIQENMLKIDISQIGQSGDTFFSTYDTAYLIFMLIGICGYFTVPNVANYIVQAGGANALLQKVTSIVSTSTMAAGGVMSAGAGRAAQGASNILQAGKHFNEGYSGEKEGAGGHGAVGRAMGHAGGYLHDRLSGN
ncbi:conjugative transposon protein TraJ [Olivibacter jilunii]|uniref:conjugative transposon protein TraJ n=1 Tax=Olivibacter jilunii TaxID=985016 RepID=UPI001032011E|nr:conjugative transposon protein TraJ [Olivibacter jilunii]